MKGRPVVWILLATLFWFGNGFAPQSVRSPRVFTARPRHTRPLSMVGSAWTEAQTSAGGDPEPNDTQVKDSSMDFIDRLKTMDINGAINNGLIFLVSAAVLVKLSMVDQGMTRGWTASETAVRLTMDNWADYYQVLTESPIQTKAATSATVYTIGDIIAQRTEGVSMGKLDRARILRSLLAGALGHGPLSHYWYEISEKVFNDYLHWTQWWSFFPKVMVDQATWGPFWNNTYIIMLGLMKGESWASMWGDIKRTTVPLIVSGLKLWGVAHCVTYGLVPVENRLLWVDIVEIVWVTILATQCAGGQAIQEGEKETTTPAEA